VPESVFERGIPRIPHISSPHTVSFKKTKIPGAQKGRFVSVRDAYETIRVRNTFSAYLL
jgi:hypothetical protein